VKSELNPPKVTRKFLPKGGEHLCLPTEDPGGRVMPREGETRPSNLKGRGFFTLGEPEGKKKRGKNLYPSCKERRKREKEQLNLIFGRK